MEKEFKWKQLPAKVHITTEAATFKEPDRGVEPITHSKFTGKQRKQVLDDLQKRAKAEINKEFDANADAGSSEDNNSSSEGEEAENADLNIYLKTSSKILSKTQQSVCKKVIAGMAKVRSAVSKKEPNNLIDVVSIVGAVATPSKETVFLVHYEKWSGHEDEYYWQAESELDNFDSLTSDDLISERVSVGWRFKTARSECEYNVKFAVLLICSCPAGTMFYEGELKNRISGSKFEILYEDNDEEILDLHSLQLAVPAANHSIRSEWYLIDHVPNDHVRNRLTELFDGLQTCVNAHQNKNKAASPAGDATNPTSRNRRRRVQTNRFQPEQNLNDKEMKRRKSS